MKKTIRRMWIAMLTAMIISVPVMAEIESDDKRKGEIVSTWVGPVLYRVNGTVMGPSGKETYYNLDMSGVISIMRNAGYSEDEYPYWVREDGCKMLGDYIMIACNLDLRPRGTLVETSLGTGIVCDTSSVFVGANVKQIDVAVTW